MTRKSKRIEILEAALKLIERAESDVSLGEIAQEASVSRQAIYLHFRDRASLLLAAVHHADERRGLSEALRFVESAGSAEEMLRRWVEMQARDNPKIWGVARATDALRRGDPDLQAAWQDRMGNRLRICRDIVKRLQRERRLRSGMKVETAAEWLAMCTSLRAWENLVLEQGWSVKQFEERVVAMVCNGLVRS